MILVLACWPHLVALSVQDESFAFSRFICLVADDEGGLAPRLPAPGHQPGLPDRLSLDDGSSPGECLFPDDEDVTTLGRGLDGRERPARERSLRLSAIGRTLGGRVQVREHQVPGTPLELGSDLGYGLQLGGRLEATYAAAGLRSSIAMEYLDGTAREDARRDFFFNGAPYQKGEPLRTLTHFLTVRIQSAWEAIADSGGERWMGPVLGIEYPYYYMNLTSRSNPNNSEDWTHYYPYPVIGWAGSFALAEGLSFGGRATVGYVPNLPAAFIEGGRLYISVRPSVWVEIPLTWELSRSFRIRAGFEYQLWHGGDHSVEDGNVLRISSPGASLSVELAW